MLDNSLTKRKRVQPDLIREKLAKTSTLYPDTVSLRLTITKPLEALQAIILCSYFKPWQTDTLIRSIAHRAYANCYQGKWQLVQEVLELQDQTPKGIEQYLVELNPYQFFGNILPGTLVLEHRVVYKDISKRAGKIKVKRYNSREYKDKGSRRLPHEIHGDPPLRKEREDRRNRVNHPILLENRERKIINPNPDSGYATEYIQERGNRLWQQRIQ